MGIKQFFEKIWRDLYTDVYLALGGSIEDQTLDWATKRTEILQTLIKMALLLAMIAIMYWLFVYSSKFLRKVGVKSTTIANMRAWLRYVCIVLSILAIMLQFGAKSDTISAMAWAAVWAGAHYALLMSLGSIVRFMLKPYGFNESVEQLIKNLLSVLILMLASAIVLAQFGVNIVSIVAGLSALGLAVGFAARDTLANFIAGIAVLIEQSFRVGDWVRLGDKEGRVLLISLRSTQILDRDNSVIIIPNAAVAASEVINFTSKKSVRFGVSVRIDLHADINKARQIMLDALQSQSVVLGNPAPTVTLASVDDFYCTLIARFWVVQAAVARIPIIKENLTEVLKNALSEAGFEAPYPHLMHANMMHATPSLQIDNISANANNSDHTMPNNHAK